VERIPLISNERFDLFWRLQFASVQPTEVIQFKYERQLRADFFAEIGIPMARDG
jgi:hypothetical protein